MAKRPREPGKGAMTLREHVEDVKGRNMARFLAEDMTVIKEMNTDEVDKAIDTLEGTASGLVIDRPVDQKLLDRLVLKGLSFVAARDFRGIIKGPLSIRLIRMWS